MDLSHQNSPPRQYYQHQNYPSYHSGSPPGDSTSPTNSISSQQHYPQPAINFHPAGSPVGGAVSLTQNSPSADSRLSGGSGIGYRPPSVQSSGYRLAKGISESEGYLEPRSSGSSFQSQTPCSLPARQHDSGVDIDHLRESGHQDVHRSSGSDQSTKSSVNFHPNGAIGWRTSDTPAKDSDLHNDKSVNAQTDIPFYRHDYEELPMNKDKYPGYSDVDDNTQSNLSSCSQMRRKHDDNNTDNMTGPTYRRRQNPLYDAILREDSKVSSKSTNHGVSRCLCLSIVLLTVLSFLALILACIALTGITTTEPREVYVQLEQAYEKIAKLEARYKALADKYEALHDVIGRERTNNMTIQEQLTEHGTVLNVISNSTSTNLGFVRQVEGQVQQVKNDTSTASKILQAQLNRLEVRVNVQNTTLDHLQNKISALETSDVAIVMSKLTNHSSEISSLAISLAQIQTGFSSFKTEIRGIAQNISKMPGPVGPPGVGNLSQCEHRVTSRGTGIGTNQFSTQWIPSVVDHQTYVILGLECSTNTEFQELRIQSDEGFDQFSCRCQGNSQPTADGSRFCELHYWRCPKIS